jgi:sugar phosphate isomerase/epimerase
MSKEKENELTMSSKNGMRSILARRTFLKGAGGSLAAGLLVASAATSAKSQTPPESIVYPLAARPLTDKEKVARIASNSYPIRFLFKSRSNSGDQETVVQMKKKYGEITMLDFPEFTKNTFPGVYQMDMMPTLFGDVDDESQYIKSAPVTVNGVTHTPMVFDPSSVSGKKWLEKMANKQIVTGTKCHHLSNDVPRDISAPDVEKRKAGVEVAKKWLDAAAMLGAKSMRVNTGGPRLAPVPIPGPTGHATNDALVQLMSDCIESFKEMADYGAKVGVRVTIENHWGIAANPINIRAIIEEVNNPFCEASPDFGNWEHEYLMYHAIQDLAPYAHTNVHAKYWDRWKTQDVQRNVRIMLNNNYTGLFALEYEKGPWDGVEGAQYLYREVLAAL